MQETLLGFGAIFLLAMLRIPLAYAMGIVGFGGIGLLISWPAANASVAQVLPCYQVLHQLEQQLG